MASSETKAAEVTIQAKSFDLAEIEWLAIQACITAHEGNMSASARALGIDRRTLYRKLAAKGIGESARARYERVSHNVSPFTVQEA
jgi:two-component system response regulator RegA